MIDYGLSYKAERAVSEVYYWDRVEMTGVEQAGGSQWWCIAGNYHRVGLDFPD